MQVYFQLINEIRKGFLKMVGFLVLKFGFGFDRQGLRIILGKEYCLNKDIVNEIVNMFQGMLVFYVIGGYIIGCRLVMVDNQEYWDNVVQGFECQSKEFVVGFLNRGMITLELCLQKNNMRVMNGLRFGSRKCVRK